MMHFFMKLQSEIKKILLNYQDLSNQQDSLMTLVTHLKNNFHKFDTMIVKKSEKDICTRNVFNWTSHFNDWRSVKHALCKQQNNIDEKSDSFFLHLKTKLNVICYHCQEKNHYANNYIKSINNLNHICISVTSQSKKKNISLKSQCQQNKKQK